MVAGMWATTRYTDGISSVVVPTRKRGVTMLEFIARGAVIVIIVFFSVGAIMISWGRKK